MPSNDEEYYDTLIEFLSEPDAVERWLKACVVAYAINVEQLQSLVGCGEEVYEYLDRIDTFNPPTGLDGYWVREAHRDFEEFESVKEQIWRSKVLLQEYIDLWGMTRSSPIKRK